MMAAPLIQAERSYVGTWGNIYPASSSEDNANCALCHNSYSSGSGFNPYGFDISNSTAGSISNRIIDVEGADSDSDPTSSSNIAEINASAQPGWTGSAPAGVTGDLDPAVNMPPVADANGPYFGTAEQQLLFDGSGSDDPDGTITAYDWTFGDGNTGTGVSPTHTYSSAGTYDVSLVVTDDDGEPSAPSTTTANIESAPQDPVADPNGPYNGIVGQAVAFDGSASFDPDGGDITQYDWDFGDGNTGIGLAPSHTYTADGSYTVTLTVVDDEGVQSAPVSTLADIVPASEDPVPDIKANGSDGPLQIAFGTPLQVDVSLNANGAVGQAADWWLAAEAPGGLYWYDIGGNWVKSAVPIPTYTGALFDLAPMEVLNSSNLPVGSYRVNFGVDSSANGTLDFDVLFVDTVDVTIQ
jgi:chitodextrinase